MMFLHNRSVDTVESLTNVMFTTDFFIAIIFLLIIAKGVNQFRRNFEF